MNNAELDERWEDSWDIYVLKTNADVGRWAASAYSRERITWTQPKRRSMARAQVTIYSETETSACQQLHNVLLSWPTAPIDEAALAKRTGGAR